MSALRVSGRAGATVGDGMVIVSILVLGGAMVLPRLQESARESRLDEVATRVEALRASAEAHRGAHQLWPAAAEPSQAPAELSGLEMTGEGYALEWLRWEVVQRVEDPVVEEIAVLPEEDLPGDSIAPINAPPALRTIGGIAVHTPDPILLAGLLVRYGTTLSFVGDTIWTLVIPTRAGSGTP